MATARIFRINYKSDFILTLHSDAGWMTPFCIKFWTGAPSQAYYASFDGTDYTNCAAGEDPKDLTVQFDDHGLPIGDLKFQVAYHFTVADFPNDTEDEVINQANITTEIDGQTYQVMLDFNGETAPEIEFSLPAYANEAQRIENEQTRIANEESRVANEEQRVENEQARVEEYADLKADAVAATAAANDAAALANQKAQLAQQKAGLADDAATLATQKAGLADDAATLATQKAGLANDAAALATQKAGLAGDAATLATQKAGLANDAAALANQKAQYASDQGDYAKAQGDYAKAQADVIPVDVTRSQTDATFVNGDHNPLFYLRQANYSLAGLLTAAGYTKLNDMPSAQEVNAGLAYDVSVLHPTSGVSGGSTYASLSAALAVIPQDKRKGGMTVKFVLSSDNKYVQYFLTKDEWSVNEADWEKMNLEEEISQLGQKAEEPSFNFGGDWSQYIPMSLGYIVCNGAAGTVVNLTPVAHSTYKCGVVNCNPGDILYIKGNGGYSDRLYCFIDSEEKVISSAVSNIQWTDYHKLVAPSNTAKVIINDETGRAISFIGEKALDEIGKIPIVARCLDMQYDGDKTVTMDTIYIYRYNQLFATVYCDGDEQSHSPKAFTFGGNNFALLVLDSNYNVVERRNNASLREGDIVLLSYSDTLGFDGGGLLYQSLSRIKDKAIFDKIDEAIDNMDEMDEKVHSLFSGKPFDLETGGISKKDGSEIITSARRTQFIKIQPGCDLYVRTYAFGASSSLTMLALYDSNKQFIQAELPTATQVYYTALQLKDLGAAYFRCTISVPSITNGYACIAHGSYNNLYFQARCLDLVINSQDSVTIDQVFLYSKAGNTTVYADGDSSSHSPKTFTFGYPNGALLVLDSEEKLVQRLNNGDLLDGDIVLLSHNETVGFDGGLLYGEYLRVKLSETPTVDVDNSQVFQSAKKIADSYGNGLTQLSIDCDTNGYELPTTRQELDIQKKIEQLTSIKWTPLGAIPNIDGSGSFAPGVENTGMPYSSVKERDKFVGFDVSLYTFMTAINNPYSLIYTENVSSAHSASAWGKTYHGVNCGTYYGVVCNVFATQCCGFKVIWNTQQHDWQSNYLFNLIRVFNQSAQGLKIGDIVWRSGHDQIVYSIKRNSDGDVIGVILAESMGLAHISSEITAQEFDNLLVTHIVYRGMELYKNKYVPSPFVAIRDEVITPFVYNDDICCFAGDKACFREGETIAINYNLKQIGAWTAMELYKNGSLLETISLDTSSHVLDLTSRNLSYGKYKARLTDGTNNSDYTEFEILETTVTTEVQGDKTKISFFSINGTPLYFRICDIAGNNKGTHEFTDKELNDGYCSIDLVKLNSEQYPSSPISGNTYIKVFFQGEFGRVTNEPLQFNS